MTLPMKRIAVISVHGCPVIQAGLKDAGGMNIYVLETARALSARGLRVDIFTRHHDPLDPMIVHLTPGARAIHLPSGPPSTDKSEAYDLLPEFTRQVTGYAQAWGLEYDLVVSHYWLSGLVGMELCALWNVPHATSFHTLAEVKRQALPDEDEHRCRHESETKIARSADQVIVWTEHEYRMMVDLYGASPERIQIIPPGVDSTRFAPVSQADSRAALNLNGEKVLLYVGRLERLKGIDTLFNVMAQLGHRDDIRLYIAGGSRGTPGMRRLLCLARDLGIRHKIKFLGSIPQERLKTYYNAADICVLPSYYESFGFAALEAAACGKPVVASRVGGLTAVVKDGETGFLVNWRCPSHFVERLELLLRNDELRKEMGTAARLHALTLTWDNAADRLVDAYSQLIDTEVIREPQMMGTLQPL
jgi:D-inositol-3-phosphate glycosyltransferase